MGEAELGKSPLVGHSHLDTKNDSCSVDTVTEEGLKTEVARLWGRWVMLAGMMAVVEQDRNARTERWLLVVAVPAASVVMEVTLEEENMGFGVKLSLMLFDCALLGLASKNFQMEIDWAVEELVAHSCVYRDSRGMVHDPATVSELLESRMERHLRKNYRDLLKGGWGRSQQHRPVLG